jgi:hypothetical protein
MSQRGGMAAARNHRLLAGYVMPDLEYSGQGLIRPSAADMVLFDLCQSMQ